MKVYKKHRPVDKSGKLALKNVNQKVPDLVNDIKTSSSAWIKEKQLSKYKLKR